MSKSCKGLAYELVKCIAESDCVKVGFRGGIPRIWHSSSLGVPARSHLTKSRRLAVKEQHVSKVYRGLLLACVRVF